MVKQLQNILNEDTQPLKEKLEVIQFSFQWQIKNTFCKLISQDTLNKINYTSAIKYSILFYRELFFLSYI